MLDYGIIGNCKTCALVKKDTSIDWFCFPDFTSGSVFGKLVDEEQGGTFKISGVGRYKKEQEYIKNTNILKTTFSMKGHAFEVIDFFPRYRKTIPGKKNKLVRQNRIVRIVRRIKGKPQIKIHYDPKPDYARKKTICEVVENNLICNAEGINISLISNADYKDILTGRAISLDTTKYFIIGEPDEAKDFNVRRVLSLFNSTKKYWERWVTTLTTPERNKKAIVRSALALKLLTYSETGAILAAATTSLPEEIETDRTFDYRFCWVRDASFTVDALKKIGRNHEAKGLMEFIFKVTLGQGQSMQIMYDIHGETKLTEKSLDHLAGYKNSKPVRIGNAAYSQKQNDIYGSIIDVIYLYYIYYQYDKKIPLKYWQFTKFLVEKIHKHWQKEDHGIWEFRNEKKHFVYSKLMCYVGIDRAISIAEYMGKKNIAKQWRKLRDTIKIDIEEKGWCKTKKAYSMYYGTSSMDAANLMMNYHDFLDDKDERMISTVKKIQEELGSGIYVQRYKIPDDFGKSTSAFTICSFWLLDALYNIGEKKQATKMYKQLMKKSNHLGLFSEDLDIATGKLLGNFPQAYTHIAVINSSILLSEWSQKRIIIQRKGKNKVM